ncbi:MAG: DUF1223 domain-containing protein [Betaproteobacteria bacterium]|nr:DUF1223 domain-containing protein [Betaproteobacteria bacterium]
MKKDNFTRFILSFLLLMSMTTVRAEVFEPFVLVELYTSQGCSSCPPADQYLSQIVNDKQLSNKNVIALSFHVDYWNRLGWKDPYSSAFNTQRQNAYAKVLKSNSVYTPQMVINGQLGFVGSNRKLGAFAIEQALTQAPTKSIDIKRVDSSDDKIVIEYKVIGDEIAEMVLNLVIAEKSISSKVDSGENRGRTLIHDNVVRVFETYDIDESPEGLVELLVPGNLVKKNSSIVAFLQKKGQKTVENAKMIPFL